MATAIFHNLLLRPLRLSTTVPSSTTSLLRLNNPTKLNFSALRATPPLTTSLTLQQENNPTELEEIKENGNSIIVNNDNININNGFLLEKREVPELSVKEKKELGSYAHSLGDKLKSQQVGKSGVTHNVFFAFNETLEKRELLKLKIHKSCPGELEDVIKQLEQGTGSVVVGQIGRTVLFYRPSVTKMKAEKKKEENGRIFEQKRQKFQAAARARNKPNYSSS